MKITFHIIRRTEHFGINHLTLFYREFQSAVLSDIIYGNMADMTTSFNHEKCNSKFKVGKNIKKS